ncbi:peptidoglycan editing factor PgeF [Cytobacillus gottheilii]|uniref:peptidoglycan editing factor PgeF n=1 Tax=Cytobacillus gottheilii TaxID=859144 RepID=UPI0009BB8815|nr:peptidoglycan editing factor PgeF [Cytobacillus gottheilii]
MEPFTKQTKEYLTINHWVSDFPQLAAGFSTKNGGFSDGDFTGLNMGFHVSDDQQAVLKNREHLAGKLDFSLSDWIGADQTHEVNVAKVTSKDGGLGALQYESSFPQTDGFYTNNQGILLTLCYADCVPLYFLHRQTKTIGLAHAGWKGTVHGIAEKMIAAFNSEGIAASEVEAVIGPSICKHCYVVDDRVVKAADRWKNDDVPAPYKEISEGQYQLDLKQLNRQIMIQSGIAEKNLVISNYCTSCNADLFYSHRRDGGKTGRMISFMGWKEE